MGREIVKSVFLVRLQHFKNYELKTFLYSTSVGALLSCSQHLFSCRHSQVLVTKIPLLILLLKVTDPAIRPPISKMP